MKEHTHNRNIDDTGRDVDTGELVFEIVTRPILYHEVIVYITGRGERRRTVQPIPAEFGYGVADGYVDDVLHDGETVVACVPATPGSYAVFAAARTEHHDVNKEICLGSVIGGDVAAPKEFDPADWMEEALYQTATFKW